LRFGSFFFFFFLFFFVLCSFSLVAWLLGDLSEAAGSAFSA
jgi:hypothetical protein